MDFKIKNPTATITVIFTESRNATQATARPYCLLTNSVLGLGVSTAFCVTVQSSLGNALLLTDYFKSLTYISKGLKSNPHRRMVHLQIMVVWFFSKLSSSRHSQGFSLSLSPLQYAKFCLHGHSTSQMGRQFLLNPFPSPETAKTLSLSQTSREKLSLFVPEVSWLPFLLLCFCLCIYSPW